MRDNDAASVQRVRIGGAGQDESRYILIITGYAAFVRVPNREHTSRKTFVMQSQNHTTGRAFDFHCAKITPDW